jgi:DNA-binding winged helix-turn-helix (wHTH) protein
MADKIRFGVYELDREAMELRKHGVVLRLQEQPFRVLAMLAGRPGEIVTREELQEQIWGNTFVDFDQSLNKAINRVREALNDNAGTPQYVETVPRRGYRFIAPVADIEQAAVTPAALLTPALAVEPAQSRPHRSKSGPMMITALAIVSVLAALGIAAWLRQTPKSTVQEPRHITSAGTGPSLSPDGKLLAYAQMVGGGEGHIMVQQIAGNEAVPITSGPYSENLPVQPVGQHALHATRCLHPGQPSVIWVRDDSPQNRPYRYGRVLCVRRAAG